VSHITRTLHLSQCAADVSKKVAEVRHDREEL